MEIVLKGLNAIIPDYTYIYIYIYEKRKNSLNELKRGQKK